MRGSVSLEGRPQDETDGTGFGAAGERFGAVLAQAAPDQSGWIYHQRSGELTHDGQHVATGHSGDGAGRNNPARQAQANVGPIPRGSYMIGAPFTSRQTGPEAMRLMPQAGTDTHGRSDFEIHGGSRAHPDHDSTGCIILDRQTRESIAASPDHRLRVVPE